MYLHVSIYFSISLCLYLSIYLFISLSLSHSVCLSVCLSLSLSVCLSLSLSLSVYLYLSLSLSLQAKHIQFVSGVQASSYWLSTFAFDLLNALIPSILTFILFAAFNLEGYRGENLAAIFLLLVSICPY